MLDVLDILKHDGQMLDQQIQLNIKEIEHNFDKIVFDNSLVFCGDIVCVDQIITVKGIVTVEFKMPCYSCNEIQKYTYDIDINEVFRNQPEDEEYEIVSSKIDLEKAVIDNLILKLPTTYRCKEDCQGICPNCGKNRNIEKCTCNTTKIDERLEKLKELL